VLDHHSRILSDLLFTNSLRGREGDRRGRGRKLVPAPGLDELEPVAIGEGVGDVSVGESVAAVNFP